MNKISEYYLDDMYLSYFMDDSGQVGMSLIPLKKKDALVEKNCALEGLIQLHVRGDKMTPAYGNGHTMCLSESTYRMKFISQDKEGDKIITTLSDGKGRIARHILVWNDALRAVRICTEFENGTHTEITLEMLSSMSIGGLTPFSKEDAPNTLLIHRARSAWSAEGRLVTNTAEELQLEPSWSKHGIRVEKLGQIGSMPVRKFFPFAAVEDKKQEVTWAMQIACPSSWQIELRRKDNGLSVTGGLADYDFGHWAKTLKPNESFQTPEVFFTAGCGGVDLVSQRLLSIHMENFIGKDRLPPVMFNEFCTTWGIPSHENLSKIVDCLKGRNIEYLVIDCGWYGSKEVSWGECSGDWIPNNSELFPQGLKKTVDMIKNAGFRPGIWFEPETCGPRSEIGQKDELLLKRNGTVIDTGGRRFLDMRKPEVQKYLNQRVIEFLKDFGFEYIKIDYNESLGIGCDGAESLGEGLRQNMEASLSFFRHMRSSVPGLCIENCSSGGHRLEPAMMSVSDMASFSDAHECIEIPIIAASLQRFILPAQSQIWAVLHGSDTIRRINYSLINTLLGVMCLSGDIYSLNDEQWEKVGEGIRFYQQVRHIILNGVSEFFGEGIKSWRHPEGWQAVCRTGDNGDVLITVHTFGGEIPKEVKLPVKASAIRRTLCSERNELSLKNGELIIALKANFEAVAVYLDMR